MVPSCVEGVSGAGPDDPGPPSGVGWRSSQVGSKCTRLNQVVGGASTRTERGRALVGAALQDVARHGFEGLRLREVAAAAGIDHSTLHHHFATKHDLIVALVEETTRPFWATMPAEGPPPERLQQHLGALTTMMSERPELFVILAEVDLRARRDPEVASIVRGFEAGWRTALREVLQSGSAAGHWNVDADVVAETILATVKGVRLEPGIAAEVLPALVRLVTR